MRTRQTAFLEKYPSLESLDEVDEHGSRFGHWLAGFIDGEGTFWISPWKAGKKRPHQKGTGWSCTFCLSLRDDDHAIIRTCQKRTGLGSLRRDLKRGSGERPGANPQIRWTIASKQDCQRLVEILERFPNLAKKKKDFELWREAVGLQSQIRRPGGRQPKQHPNQYRLGALQEKLKALRKYSNYEDNCREVLITAPSWELRRTQREAKQLRVKVQTVIDKNTGTPVTTQREDGVTLYSYFVREL